MDPITLDYSLYWERYIIYKTFSHSHLYLFKIDITLLYDICLLRYYIELRHCTHYHWLHTLIYWWLDSWHWDTYWWHYMIIIYLRYFRYASHWCWAARLAIFHWLLIAIDDYTLSWRHYASYWLSLLAFISWLHSSCYDFVDIEPLISLAYNIYYNISCRCMTLAAIELMTRPDTLHIYGWHRFEPALETQTLAAWAWDTASWLAAITIADDDILLRDIFDCRHFDITHFAATPLHWLDIEIIWQPSDILMIIRYIDTHYYCHIRD